MGHGKRRIYRGLKVKRRLIDYDEVYFTGHALKRMSQRGITQEDVFRTIEKPDATNLPTATGRFRVRWEKTDQYGIDVVYELLEDLIRVITTIKIRKDSEKGKPPKILRVKNPKRNKRRKGRR